ncbi:MAG: mechanosensitive ion channel [Saprospiraceae bacterium]|nr:mechanosensitive ion channel [Saprospiraceae bacterium]MCB9325272.1 mechanosensitive ion channel [Lewinellaceae bacterium]
MGNTDKGFTLMGILGEQLSALAGVLPKLIGAVTVFILGWILAKLIAKLLKKFLGAIGIDKLAEKLNEIEIVYNSNIKIVPSTMLSKIAYYLVLFIFIMAATEVLGMQAVSDLMTSIMNYIPKVLSALIVLIIGVVIADTLKKAVFTACESLAIPASKLISNVAFYFLFLNVIMISLKQADLQTDFIENNMSIILAGVVLAFALGYGFASKGLMASMLSSFYHKEKISIGQTISIDGTKGTVKSIDGTTFTLETEESDIIIPLSKLMSEKVEIFKPNNIS